MTHINNAILHKFSSIEHAIKRMRNVYISSSDLTLDLTSQDSIIFNLQRACEACIDIANIINKQHRIGIPSSGQDSFELLKKAGLLSPQLTENLQKMVEFKSKTVRDYQTMNLETMKHVVENKLGEFTDFIAEMKKQG